jgi:hypothetical protein
MNDLSLRRAAGGTPVARQPVYYPPHFGPAMRQLMMPPPLSLCYAVTHHHFWRPWKSQDRDLLSCVPAAHVGIAWRSAADDLVVGGLTTSIRVVVDAAACASRANPDTHEWSS